MNANKRGLFALALTAVTTVLVSGSALSANLDARSTTKVNNAMAKKWSGGDSGAPINPAQQNKQVVNFGSKKNNTCNLNVGTAAAGKTKAGQKAPKEIIVTTKDVINICK